MNATTVKRPDTQRVVTVAKQSETVVVELPLIGESVEMTIEQSGHKVEYGTIARSEDGVYWRAVGEYRSDEDVDLELSGSIVNGWQYIGPVIQVVDHLIEPRWVFGGASERCIVCEQRPPMLFRKVCHLCAQTQWGPEDRISGHPENVPDLTIFGTEDLFGDNDGHVLNIPQVRRGSNLAPFPYEHRQFSSTVDEDGKVTYHKEEAWTARRVRDWFNEHDMEHDGTREHYDVSLQQRIHSLKPCEPSEVCEWPGVANPNAYLRKPLRQQRRWGVFNTIGEACQLPDLDRQPACVLR